MSEYFEPFENEALAAAIAINEYERIIPGAAAGSGVDYPDVCEKFIAKFLQLGEHHRIADDEIGAKVDVDSRGGLHRDEVANKPQSSGYD